MLAIVTWAYRQGTLSPAHYLKQLGLWDLDGRPEADLKRLRTPLVDAYRELVAKGSQAVGKLKEQHVVS